METLYRKYRPKTFADLIGQNHVRAVLEGELLSDRIAHAYLFSGPRGVGKTSVARIFSRAINCENRAKGSAEPCGACDSCREIQDARTLDIVEIDAASNTGVDHVREQVIENARVVPAHLKYKVFIIDEVHMLSTSAFNALLKTLEEPPRHAIFILATTELHKVPETILSRCQRFDFKRVSVEEITKILHGIAIAEEVRVDADVLLAVARLAEGCPRDAESLLGQVLALGGKTITKDEASLVLPHSDRTLVVELIGFIASHNTQASVALIGRSLDEGVELGAFTREMISVLRDLLLAKLVQQSAVPVETLPANRDAIATVTATQVARMIERFSVARRELERADIVQLPLELAVVELCVTNEEVKIVA